MLLLVWSWSSLFAYAILSETLVYEILGWSSGILIVSVKLIVDDSMVKMSYANVKFCL